MKQTKTIVSRLKYHQSGLSLIELIITMVVLAFGLSGILAMMITVARNSVAPLIQWQAVMIGDSILNELLTKEATLDCAAQKGEDISHTSLCDYQGIKNASIDSFFPSLAMPLKDESHFKVSVNISPMSTQAHIAKISIIVSHDQLGDMHFTGLKALTRESHEKAMRFYTY